MRLDVCQLIIKQQQVAEMLWEAVISRTGQYSTFSIWIQTVTIHVNECLLVIINVFFTVMLAPVVFCQQSPQAVDLSWHERHV